MHDLHLADKIYKLVLEKALGNNIKKISQIDIEIGSLTEHGIDVSPENLEFNILMLAKGGVAEHARINIIKVPGNDWKLISIAGD